MQKSSRNTAKATCILVIHSFIQLACKINLIDQAKAQKKLIWRENCEVVLKGCTAKGSKIGHGGKVKVFFAISLGKSICLIKYYEKNIW